MSWEKVLAEIVLAGEPTIALERAITEAEPPLRAQLAAIDPNGLRLAHLLVARLRFTRLVRGSPHADAWFERDPADFADAFRAYCAAVPPTAFHPADEARLFEDWRTQ